MSKSGEVCDALGAYTPEWAWQSSSNYRSDRKVRCYNCDFLFGRHNRFDNKCPAGDGWERSPKGTVFQVGPSQDPLRVKRLNIQILSDLHFEFQTRSWPDFVSNLDETDVDILVLAGDIFARYKKGEEIISRFCSKYPDVVMIAGNHEFYHGTITEGMKILSDIQSRIPNFHFLGNSDATVRGQHFYGGTMWYPEPGPLIDTSIMNEYTTVHDLVPEAYNQNATFFQNAGCITPDTVVVTHHLPSSKSVPEKFKGNPENHFYVCDVSYKIKDFPKIWIHGHTHASNDYMLGRTRVVSNPYGYHEYETNPDFIVKKVITL